MDLSQDELNDMFNEANMFLKPTPDNTIITKKQNDFFCESCNDYSLISDKLNGIIVCTKCGIITTNQLIDDSAEWAFGADEAASGGKDPARCGMPTSVFFPKSSCSTIITGGKNNHLMKKLHMQMSMDYVERSRYHLFNKIGRMCDVLSPIVLETTKHIYLDLEKLKLSRGNVRKGLIACCIFYACKQHNMSRSIKEIASICDIEPAVVNNSNKVFQSVMADHYISEHFKETTETDDLLSRFCSYLSLQRKDTSQIIKIIKPIQDYMDEEQLLIGKTPSAITAAYILYAVEKLSFNITKKTISEKLNVSIVTINKISQTIHNNSEFFN